jgi:hypothetical protein
MSIARASKKNRLKPHRGGMGWPVGVHAAPTGLGRIAGRGVTINMSPRWGVAPANARIDWLKPRRATPAERPACGRGWSTKRGCASLPHRITPAQFFRTLVRSLSQSKSVGGEAGKVPLAPPGTPGRRVSATAQRWLSTWPSAKERLAAPL